MGKNHLKRIRAPRSWAIARKSTKFIARPRPGGQSILYTLPLSVLLKEHLRLFATTKELKYVLNKKAISVNHIPRTDPRFPVGLLDIITLSDLHQNHLIIINTKGKIVPHTLPEKQSKTKIAKITNKRTISGGKVQLTTLDGRTLLVEKDTFKTGDSIQISLPDQKIIAHDPLLKGARILIFKGSHTGKIVTIDDIHGSKITFTYKNIAHETQKDFVIVLGNMYSDL
jgi:small subunit ribosomal protein S4e